MKGNKVREIRKDVKDLYKLLDIQNDNKEISYQKTRFVMPTAFKPTKLIYRSTTKDIRE